MKNDGEIKISFTGDVMCEHIRLKDFETDCGYCFTPLFDSCRRLFADSDYVVANLETPIAGKNLKYSFKDYNFNTPEQFLEAMVDSGIKMVTTANNHVLDRGIEGIDCTIDNIVAVGLDYTGTSKTGNRMMPLIKDFHGLRVAFISYTYGTEACYNYNYLKPKDQYRVNLLQNQELYNPIIRFVIRNKSFIAKCIRYGLKIAKPSLLTRTVEEFPQSSKRQRKEIIGDIEYCKKHNADIIIACLHLGGQFNDEPTEFSQRNANFFINSGVDVVVGNHEHLIQKAQLRMADAKIAYCLGNFTSNYSIDRAPYDKEAQCSIVLHIYLSKENGECKQRFTFTVMLSVRKNNMIVTKPLYDEWNSCTDRSRKDELFILNQKSVQRFLGKECAFPLEPRLEYNYDEMIEQ